MNCAVHTQTQAAAYCRTCGKALCEDCKRDVVGAIYCEPCIAARLQSSVAPGGRTMPPPPPSAPGAPNPGLAGFLGLIPGVGAMYNGQFAKALVHVVIFILLIFGLNANLPDGVEVVFALFTAFFVLYMAFEAFKTAQAKQFGLPAPDPLGLDKMFGLQDSQATASVNADVTVGGPVQVPPPLAAPGRQDNVPVA